MPTLKHIWRLASIKQSAGRAGPHAEKGAEAKKMAGTSFVDAQGMPLNVTNSRVAHVAFGDVLAEAPPANPPASRLPPQ